MTGAFVLLAVVVLWGLAGCAAIHMTYLKFPR